MSSDYEMWITWDNDTQRFPIRPLPEKIEIDNGTSHQTIDLVGTGKVVIPAERGIKSVKFTSFFPSAGFTGLAHKSVRNPQTLINILTHVMNNRQPVRFIFTGCQLNFHAMLKINYNEVGGDVGTKHYTIELYQFVQPLIRQIKVNNAGNKVVTDNGSRIDNSTGVTTYTVQKGDYLIKIARKLLGDSSRYMEIFKLNPDLIKDPNLIYAGWVLKIPPK